MPGASRQGQYLVTRFTTGTQDPLLMLDLADERISTVIRTLRLQKRIASEFLGRTFQAHCEGRAKPQLCFDV